MTKRLIQIFIACLLTQSVSLQAQEGTSKPFQVPPNGFEIDLPQTINSAEVQIHCYLRGPFGGYESTAAVEPGENRYTLPAEVDGKEASDLKALILAPGCQLDKISISLSEDPTRRHGFECNPLPDQNFTGRIDSDGALNGSDYSIQISLVLPWAMNFFGYQDGIAPQFRIGTLTPNADGTFFVHLPDLKYDPWMRDVLGTNLASFEFSALKGDLPGSLEPEAPALTDKGGRLAPEAAYPPEINFTFKPR